MPVKSESSNAIKNIEENDSLRKTYQAETKLIDDVLSPELEAALRELQALKDRGDAIKEGRAVPEFKFGDVIFPAMSERDVQRFNFEGGDRGKALYLGGEPFGNPDRAFLACLSSAKKSIVDSDAEFQTRAYNYAGRRENGDYVVDVFFVARNAFNAKIDSAMRCVVKIKGDKLRVVEMFQPTIDEIKNTTDRNLKAKKDKNLSAKEFLNQKCGRDWDVMYTDETGCRYF